MNRALAVIVAVVIVAVAACGDGGGNASPATTTTSTTTTSVPSPSTDAVGVIAIGHSGLTAENSDPARPRAVAPENSWATGTSPDVNSIYLRLVEERPETSGHVSNEAEGGAPAAALAFQLSRALESVPTPALVIIQSIDQDIRCDASNVQAFGITLAGVLEEIRAASPDAQILMVGQLARPSPSFVQQLVAAEPSQKAALTGSDECSFFNAAGELVEENFVNLTTAIERYEAEQARVCAEVPNCRTDEGARAAYVDRLENFSDDWNHLNVKGQAEAAALVWPAVAELMDLR